MSERQFCGTGENAVHVVTGTKCAVSTHCSVIGGHAHLAAGEYVIDGESVTVQSSKSDALLDLNRVGVWVFRTCECGELDG